MMKLFICDLSDNNALHLVADKHEICSKQMTSGEFVSSKKVTISDGLLL